jgi:uracil-DNA glycosylase family 4
MDKEEGFEKMRFLHSKNRAEKYSSEARDILMQKIRDELLVFKKSPLYTYRTENKYFPVVGEGSHTAHIMFIGEAPGKNEAETARPFCGRSGKVLDEMLASISLNRDDVYITNIVKDRPPENRDPTSEEIELYAPFLDRQIEIIQPKVIATLGRFSMDYIMTRLGVASHLQSISNMHGKEFVAHTQYGEVTIVPLYHPAVALYNGSNKTTLLEDFKILKKYIN